MRRIIFLSVLMSIVPVVGFSGCRPDARENSGTRAVVPPPLLSLTEDALRAAAEIKISGNADSVLASHRLSAAYQEQMRDHFALMQKLHRVSVESRIRYPRYELSLEPKKFCGDSTSASLLVNVTLRFDMESLEQAGGTPPYTASSEEHIFRFRNVEQNWSISGHHEITMAEMHDLNKIRQLRSIC